MNMPAKCKKRRENLNHNEGKKWRCIFVVVLFLKKDTCKILKAEEYQSQEGLLYTRTFYAHCTAF